MLLIFLNQKLNLKLIITINGNYALMKVLLYYLYMIFIGYKNKSKKYINLKLIIT